MLFEHKIQYRARQSDDDPPYADGIWMEKPVFPQEISSFWVFQDNYKAQIHQERESHRYDN